MAKGYQPLRRRSSDPISELSYTERNNNSYASPSREDVEVGGRVLFQHFIQEQLIHEGYPEGYSSLEVEIPPPEEFGDAGPDARHADASSDSRAESFAYLSTPDGFKNSKFIELGANIRNIADEFGRSHKRKDIHRLADNVDLRQITSEAFQDTLTELFRNGIDKYRIVSLFYFCSDILIRCIREELTKIGSKLFLWAMEFIIKSVCKWVYEHGGWERVCVKGFNVAYNIALIGALGIVICCGFVYLRNNW